MIVSFEIEKIEDVELLIQLTQRLGIKRVNGNTVTKGKSNPTDELNDEINDIFGNENSDILF
jgi:hypothetical protein